MDKNKLAVQTYEKIAEKYSNAFYKDLSDGPYLDRFIELLPEKANVIDIGCGPGQLAKYLHNKGLTVTGIDLSEEMIKIAQKKVPKILFKKMDMRHLKFSNNHFDGLLAAYSVIHIPSKQLPGLFMEFNRVLKPGGIGLVITQQGEPDNTVIEPLDPQLRIFTNLFTPQRISESIKNAGFSIVNQEISEENSEEEVFSDKIIYTYFEKL